MVERNSPMSGHDFSRMEEIAAGGTVELWFCRDRAEARKKNPCEITSVGKNRTLTSSFLWWVVVC